MTDARDRISKNFHNLESLVNTIYRLTGGKNPQLNDIAYGVLGMAQQVGFVLGLKSSMKGLRAAFGSPTLTRNYLGTRFSVWAITDHLVINHTKSGASIEVMNPEGDLTVELLQQEIIEVLGALPDPTSEPYHVMGQPVGSVGKKPDLEEIRSTIQSTREAHSLGA